MTESTKRSERIKLGITVKCKNCEKRLMRIDDPFKGFCSQRCSKIYKGIRKISPSDLHHIVFWYYLQRWNEYENRHNKRAYRGLGKLLQQLKEVFDT